MLSQGKKLTPGRIYLIDYLKAVSVIMVIFTHYNWKDKTGLFFTLIIAMAVPIFMVISGYNFSMSYLKKTDGSLKELYAPSMIGPRLYRFLLPFLIIYIPEMFLHVIMRGDSYTLYDLIRYFVRGGLGPGSYYVPVLVVMLFAFPLMFACIRRFSYWGVCMVGLVNLVYELYAWYGHMDRELYRLLFFRYLMFAALGCYMYFYFHQQQDRKKYPLSVFSLTIMFITGLAFSVAVYQFHWKPPVFRYWTKTSMPLAFYIFPIVFVLMYFFREKQIPGLPGRALAKIGQASYHIFLIQMVYYRLFDDLIFPPGPAIPVVCGNIIITVGLGYCYYLLESRLSKKLLRIFSTHKRNHR